MPCCKQIVISTVHQKEGSWYTVYDTLLDSTNFSSQLVAMLRFREMPLFLTLLSVMERLGNSFHVIYGNTTIIYLRLHSRYFLSSTSLNPLSSIFPITALPHSTAFSHIDRCRIDTPWQSPTPPDAFEDIRREPAERRFNFHRHKTNCHPRTTSTVSYVFATMARMIAEQRLSRSTRVF